MMDVVGELHVHLRVHRPESVAKLAAAEQFSRRVLSRAAEYLQAQAPGRVILVDALRLNWRLRQGRLNDGEMVERWAADLARRLTNYPPAAGLTPSPAASGDVMVFADEAHWRAAHFWARSRGSLTGAWFFAALDEEGPPLEALAALAGNGGGELVWQVLIRLAEAGVLTEVLLAWPAAPWASLAVALGVDEAWLGARKQTVGGDAKRLKPLASALAERLTPLAGKVPQSVLALATTIYVRWQFGLAGGEDGLWLVAEVVEQLKAGPETADRPLTPWESSAMAPPAAILPGEQPPVAEATRPAVIPVHWGGLFFLLNCALELNIGEILWQACLPEPLILAHALKALVGEDFTRDPAGALWTGIEALSPFPVPESSQHEEVSCALLRFLAAALPRRGLAALPTVVLTLESQPSGKLLAAVAAGSPLVIFAWPADTGPAIKAGLQAFLRNWPARAPLSRAASGLAQLDETGRVQAVAEVDGAPDLLLPQTDRARETALLAQAAGSLSYLFAARVAGGWSGPPGDFNERYLHLPAHVRVAPESLTVIFQADQIDLAVRRAGLDKDPGWVPWLGRRVGFEFADEN